MIGGMISSTLLTLIVIPAVFGIVRGFGLAAHPEQGRPAVAIAKHPKKDQRTAAPVE